MSDELNNLLLGDIEVEVEPSDGDQDRDVYNRLITLYGSRVGEQALDREFGLDISCLSLPAEAAEAAEALLTAEITRKTARYEQHAQVQQVDYSEQDGKKGYIRPKVVVKIV